MTSFFDKATGAIHALPRGLPDEEFLAEVAAIEKPVIEAVLLNTGDREFPHDLREKILEVIAIEAVATTEPLKPSEVTRRYVIQTKSSRVLGSLHSAFHTLASSRAPARWGFWSDSPSQNLVSRESHDVPKQALVVDDDPSNVDAQARALRLRGFEVRTAHNGRAALELLIADHEFQPVVILTDDDMPLMSGTEFHRQVKMVFPALEPRVIIMSGGAYAESYCKEYAVPFLSKPFGSEDLDKAIESVLP